MSEIPLPTDNVFKFYALFGLVLLVFGGSALLYVNQSTNALIFQTKVDLSMIEQIQNPTITDLAKKSVMEKRVEIAVKDRTFFDCMIGVFIGAGISLSVYGFRRWQTRVQHQEDQLVKLQIEKLRLEVEQLKNSVSKA